MTLFSESATQLKYYLWSWITLQVNCNHHSLTLTFRTTKSRTFLQGSEAHTRADHARTMHGLWVALMLLGTSVPIPFPGTQCSAASGPREHLYVIRAISVSRNSR
jgi:hypothetical protein